MTCAYRGCSISLSAESYRENRNEGGCRTKRISEFQNNNYEPLRMIDGLDVTVTKVFVEPMTVDGQSRLKSYITLDTGKTYICWSKNVGRALQKISNFPVKARFSLVTDGDKTYWTYE